MQKIRIKITIKQKNGKKISVSGPHKKRKAKKLHKNS